MVAVMLVAVGVTGGIVTGKETPAGKGVIP